MLLTYICFTMLCEFLVYSSDSAMYIHICIFSLFVVYFLNFYWQWLGLSS